MDHNLEGRYSVFQLVHQLPRTRIREIGIEDDKIQRVRVKGPFQHLDTTFGQAYPVALGFEFPFQEPADMRVAIGDQYVFEWAHSCSLSIVVKNTKQGLCQRGEAGRESAHSTCPGAAECPGEDMPFGGVRADDVDFFYNL